MKEGQKKVGLLEFETPEEAYEAMSQTGLKEALDRPQWCCFRLKKRKDGKFDKQPYSPLTGKPKGPDNLKGWTDFKTAFSKAKAGDYAGIGLNMIGYTGIDLDHCLNLETGELTPFAEKVIDTLNGVQTYSEISVSGTGIHIFFKGCLKEFLQTDSDVWGTKKELEIYSPYQDESGNIQHGRFIAITGNVFNQEGSEMLSEDLSGVVELLKQYDPEKLSEAPCERLEGENLEHSYFYENEEDYDFLIDKIELQKQCERNRNGEIFTALFNEGIDSDFAIKKFWDEDKGKVDQSQAEARLCYDLAFSCFLCFGKAKPSVIDSCFRDSAFMAQSQGKEPDKWDEAHNSKGDHYSKITIDKEIRKAEKHFKEMKAEEAKKMFPGKQETEANEAVKEQPESSQEAKTGITRFYNKNTLNHSLFADFLIEKFHIKRLEGQLYIYRNNHYSNNPDDFHRAMNSIIPNLKKQNRTEVMETIWLKIEAESDYSPPSFIGFNNGILNLETMELLNHSADYIPGVYLPYDWNPEANQETVIKFLEGLADGDKIIYSRLLEMIGYTFHFPNSFQKLFILEGPGANGKSLLTDFIEFIHGPEKCSSVGLPDLTDRFRPFEMVGKAVNICPDIIRGRMDTKAVSKLKQITGGDRTMFETKGGRPVSARIHAKLILGANDFPKTGSGDTKAVIRRFEYIPMTADFSEASGKADPHMKTKLFTKENAEAVYCLGIEALKKVLKCGGFTYDQRNEDFKADFLKNNDPFEAWKQSYLDAGTCLGEAVNGKTADEVFSIYKWFCEEKNLFHVSESALSQRILKEPDIEKVRARKTDGSRPRVFTWIKAIYD